MRKILYRPYLLLIGLLLCVMNLPSTMTERVRFLAVSSLAPSWQALNWVKKSTLNLLMISPPGTPLNSSQFSLEIDRLRQENKILLSQLTNIREWLLLDERIDEQMQRLNSITKTDREDHQWKEFFNRRHHYLAQMLDLELQAIPAKIVFREPASWGSSVWLNVGEKDNLAIGRKVIAKNSPVLVGTSIIGVVEHVGAKQCRVRLISDSGLVPSVRAIRGKEQNRYLLEYLDSLLLGLGLRDDLFATKEEAKVVLDSLHFLKEQLKKSSEDQFLAKGELYGSSQPLWRSRNQGLRGVGFNYDYSDDEGFARDLRTGEVLDLAKKIESIPLLKAGDLLVTTGMDGIFPAGFRVAIVSKVGRLQEGASTYEIEAKATAGNLDEVMHVFIVPPLQFEKS
jgi:rod shape-determining protein MreC